MQINASFAYSAICNNSTVMSAGCVDNSQRINIRGYVTLLIYEIKVTRIIFTHYMASNPRR
jgi:hypothetical protein